MERPGEAMRAERVRGLRHGGPMGHGSGGVPGGDLQHLIPETARQAPRHQRQRGDRRHPEEHGRRYLPAPPPRTDRAPLHVPVDALAHQHGQHAVPLLEHRVQVRAVPAAGPGHDERPERGRQLVARPGQQRVRVVAGDPEHAGRLAAAQALPQLQLEDFPFGRPHPAERVADQGAQVRPFHVRGDVGRFVGHLRRLLDGRVQAAAAQPAVAFVPRHRVQPGPQPLRVAQPGHPGRRDHERVLHGVRGVGGLAQHRPAEAVQRCRVPVVRLGEPCGIARHDGRDDLTVVHSNTVAA